MQRLKFLTAVCTCSFGLVLLVGVVYAGSLSPSADPAATSYTLTDIYTRLTTNATATAGDHAFAPSASPAGTLYTMTQIYDAIPTIAADRVISGTTLLGVGGTYDITNLSTASVFNGIAFGSGSTGTLTLACDTATFNGTANLVPTAYDDAGDGTNRFCMTDSGDASAGDILSGQVAWVDGQAVTGTIPTQTLSASTGAVTAGYYNATTLSTVDSDLTATNIADGVQLFGLTGSLTSGGGYPGTGWEANGSGDGSTALSEANCTSAADWYWFEDGNGDGDTSDPEDGVCVKATTVTSGSWNGDDYATERDNTYIAAYTCTGNFPSGTVATYSGINSGGTEDATWNAGDCALCETDCYDGKKDLPDQGGYTTPNEDIAGHHGPITPEVLEQWKGTRMPTSNDFFGFCGYKDGGSNYETSCSADTTIGNYGQMAGRTDECIDLSNSGVWEWLSEQHSNSSARLAGDSACSSFLNTSVNAGNRFRAVFRP